MNPDDIDNYAKNFYGYGNWEQPTWFVGMEEGGCATLAEFQRRLDSWLSNGCKDLINARKHHEAMGLSKWFRKRAPLQKTWEKLIRIHLSLHERPLDLESIRHFQINDFGQADEGFASLELFSLPAVSAQSWIYSEIIELPYLINRAVYKYYLYPKRAEYLRRRILKHKPKQVVIYGLSYRHEWEGIVRRKFKTSPVPDVIETSVDSTLVLVIPHPVARGYNQDYWTEVGNYLRTHK